MNFLSPEIKKLAGNNSKSLIKKSRSCGIFQDTEGSDYSSNSYSYSKQNNK